MTRTRGSPPKRLTGHARVSPIDSPWWARVSSELCSYGLVIGDIITVEDLSQRIPSYPDGRRPRQRTVARRLREGGVLELVQSGPNNSLSRGATYRILAPPPPEEDPNPDIADDSIPVDHDWLNEQITRMTGGKK